MDFDSQIVRNVIDSETGRTWDCTLKGKAGELGCYQIIPKYHDVDPLDFEASTRYFITAYKGGYGYWWSGCNCYGYLTTVTRMPPTREIIANATLQVGAIAIFAYPTRHYARIEKLTDTGFVVKEANKEPCKISQRNVQWNDPKLVGFYSPPTPLLEKVE